MKTIWKFPLEIVDRQPVSIPVGAQLLDVQMQGDQPCLWALVDTESPRITLVVRIYGTGHEIRDDPGLYLGTFQERTLVFHVFTSMPAPRVAP